MSFACSMLNNANTWSAMSTLAIVYLFRSFCVAVNVARHNAVMLYNLTRKLSASSITQILGPLINGGQETKTENNNHQCTVVLLEGICILQERCQVFLPGHLRRTSSQRSDKGEQNMTAVADSTENTEGTKTLLGRISSGEGTLLPFLHAMLQSVPSSTSTSLSSLSSNMETSISIKRLALRRMFELHPLEASPGTMYKKQRKAARSELKDLTSFVFESTLLHLDATMHLVASNVELLCKYATANHLDLFLKWLVDFSSIQKECSTFKRRKKQNDVDRPRLEMLMKTSFYELRPIRKRVFHVLTDMLQTSVHSIFSNATTSKGKLLYSSTLSTSNWLDSVSRPGKKESIPYFDLNVPALDLVTTTMLVATEQAESVLQLFLGLPPGYVNNDLNLDIFVRTVMELDILCHHTMHNSTTTSSSSSSSNSSNNSSNNSSSSNPYDTIHSIAALARSVMANLSSTHPDCVASLLSSSSTLLLQFLLASATHFQKKKLLPLWVEPTAVVARNIVTHHAYNNSEGAGETSPTLLLRTLQSLKELLQEVSNNDSSSVSVHAVSLLSLFTLQGVNMTSDNISVVEELIRFVDVILVSDHACKTWWTSTPLVPSLLGLGELVLTFFQEKGWTSSNVVNKMEDLLTLSTSLLSKQESEHQESEHQEISTAVLSILGPYSTLGCHDEHTVTRCLRMALMLGTPTSSNVQRNVQKNSHENIVLSSWSTPGSVFVNFVNSTTTPPRRILQAMELLHESMAIAPSADYTSVPAVVALQTLASLMSNVKRAEFWHIVSKFSARTLNAVVSVNGRHYQDSESQNNPDNNSDNRDSSRNSDINGNDGSDHDDHDDHDDNGDSDIVMHSVDHRFVSDNVITLIRSASLSVLLSMLRQPKYVSMGTHELSFCLQYLMFWSEENEEVTGSSTSALSKKLGTLTYDTLTSMLEYRPHALYTCASAYILVTRSVLRVALNQQSVAIRTHLTRYIARIFEEMSKDSHRNALRHYCLYLLHESITGVLEHGWPEHAKDDLQQGLFCLLDVCTEYQSQMLFVGLNESGRSLLRKLRSQHQSQHVWTN